MRQFAHDAVRASSRRNFPSGVALLGAALGVALLVAPALAQAVPMPRPAPKARAATDTATSDARPTPPMALPGSSNVPTPVLPDPRNRPSSSLFGSAPSFDAAQRAQASRMSSYLSSLTNLTGKFVQVGPDGSKTKGEFFIQKPGKVRFEYEAPSPIAIVADGASMVVRDQKLATQDVYPLSQTPLRFLLSDRIDLMRDTNVVSVTADDVFISVTIEEKQAMIGTSRLMLMIGAKDNQLKQWTVTDPQGYDTTVAVYNLESPKKLDPAMFRIDYTTYQGGAN